MKRKDIFKSAFISLFLLSTLAISSCFKDASTDYWVQIMNESDVDIIVDYETETHKAEVVKLTPFDMNPDRCGVDVYYKSRGKANLPKYTIEEFYSKFKKLDFYYVDDTDTIQINQLPDENFHLGNYEYVKDEDKQMDRHVYILRIEKNFR